MKAILLITKNIIKDPRGGREKLNQNIKNSLENLSVKFNFSVETYEISNAKISIFRKIYHFLIGLSDGLTLSKCDEIEKIINIKKIDIVIIDGSNYGLLAKLIKKKNPNLRLITFYHNVETEFFYQKFKSDLKLKSFLVFLSMFRAEKLSSKYSDNRVCLNNRDSKILFRWFRFKATNIIPIFLNLPATKFETNYKNDKTQILFVGGQFFGNLLGIKWFVEHVVNQIQHELVIVGKNMDIYKNEFESYKNVRVFGEQKSLHQLYQDSLVTIAPIFHGSGMKTKIAESLMFGRKIVGTKEAFVGYEKDIENIGWECNTDKEFIDILNYEYLEPSDESNKLLKKIFLENYSTQAFEKNILELFNLK